MLRVACYLFLEVFQRGFEALRVAFRFRPVLMQKLILDLEAQRVFLGLGTVLPENVAVVAQLADEGMRFCRD